MTAAEGRTLTDAPGNREHREPASPASRLDEAGQQLAIVLEAVDLEAEPELGEALVEAIGAVDEAASRVESPSDRDSGQPSRGMVFGERG